MVKKKSKKKLYIGLSAFVIFILLLMGGWFVFKPIQQTSYFYSEDTGIVKVQHQVFNKWNKWMGFFQQAVTFSDEEIDLGDTIRLTDEHTVIISQDTGDATTQCYVGQAYVKLNKPSGTTSFSYAINPPATSWETISSTFSYTSDQEGTYSADSEYWQAECTVGITGPTNCMSSISCSNKFNEPSTNTVLVIDDSPPQCTKEPYWTSWGFYQKTSDGNGDIEKRTHVEVTGDCEYEETNDEFRTTCDNGYVIEGTESSTGSGQKKCELLGGDPECTQNSDCLETQVCESEICVDKECENGDEMTIDCDDGSTIVTQVCENYRLVDTGNECEAVDCTEDDDCSTGYICIDGGCVIEPECEEDSDCDSGYICDDYNCVEEENNETNQTTNYTTEISSFTPTNTTVQFAPEDSQKFTINPKNYDTIAWYLDDSLVSSDVSSYTVSNLTAGSHTVKVIVTGDSGEVTQLWTLDIADEYKKEEGFNYSLMLLIGGVVLFVVIIGWILYSKYVKKK